MPEPVNIPKDLSVAIVGGGMGGLAAGVALGRAGVKVDLFEQAPKFEVSSGSSVLLSLERRLADLVFVCTIQEVGAGIKYVSSTHSTLDVGN